MVEYIDIYDYKGRKTGRKAPRFVPLGKEEYFKSVAICIFNPEGKMLIQQRKYTKRNWPGLWDISAAGAITAGEDSQESGMRETKEELGVEIDLIGIRPHLITSFSTGFTETYLLEKDIKLEELVLQEEEVEDARYASKEEILDMIDAGTFIRYKKSWIEYVFDNYKDYGTFEMP